MGPYTPNKDIELSKHFGGGSVLRWDDPSHFQSLDPFYKISLGIGPKWKQQPKQAKRQKCHYPLFELGSSSRRKGSTLWFLLNAHLCLAPRGGAWGGSGSFTLLVLGLSMILSNMGRSSTPKRPDWTQRCDILLYIFQQCWWDVPFSSQQVFRRGGCAQKHRACGGWATESSFFFKFLLNIIKKIMPKVFCLQELLV